MSLLEAALLGTLSRRPSFKVSAEFTRRQLGSRLFQSGSEVVITLVIFVVIRVIANVPVLVTILIIVRLFVIGLEASLDLVLTLGPEAGLGFAHFVELGVLDIIPFILEDLVLLILQVLVLQLLDHLLLLSAALAILQVVHVKLVFQIVNVGVLLDVCAVETL